MTPVHDDEFANLFESAFQEEESMSICSSLNQMSLASSSIHLLSLGPRLSSGRNPARSSSTSIGAADSALAKALQCLSYMQTAPQEG